MSWLASLTDYLVLQPTTHPISKTVLQRETIPVGDGVLEIWTTHVKRPDAKHQILLIKFPGTGGRAENSTSLPADHWDDSDTVLWTINPFGYGGSSGRATLQRFPEMVQVIAASAQQSHPDRNIIVMGVSLGSISALALSARFAQDSNLNRSAIRGVLLRNPVPIHQMIAHRPRYAIPSLGLSRWIASQIPEQLDALKNAGLTAAPTLIISAQEDRVVPPRYQNMIVDQLGGPTRVVPLAECRHNDPVPEAVQTEYLNGLVWLESQFT